MTRRISVNVGGLWRTSVKLEEEADWWDLKNEINKVTGVSIFFQKLEPTGKNDKKCELEEGDDVFCDWKLCGSHPLHHAAIDGNIEAIQLWLPSGADINMIDDLKRTPLMFASGQLEEECVAKLLQLGANANLIDKNGETALHKIAQNSDLEKMEKMEKMAKILIEAGCDPTKRNKKNETFVDILKRRNCKIQLIKLSK